MVAPIEQQCGLSSFEVVTLETRGGVSDAGAKRGGLMPSASASEKGAGVWRDLVRAVSRRNTFRPVLGGRDLFRAIFWLGIFRAMFGLVIFRAIFGRGLFRVVVFGRHCVARHFGAVRFTRQLGANAAWNLSSRL